jgi:hypothetical protein
MYGPQTMFRFWLCPQPCRRIGATNDAIIHKWPAVSGKRWQQPRDRARGGGVERDAGLPTRRRQPHTRWISGRQFLGRCGRPVLIWSFVLGLGVYSLPAATHTLAFNPLASPGHSTDPVCVAVCVPAAGLCECESRQARRPSLPPTTLTASDFFFTRSPPCPRALQIDLQAGDKRNLRLLGLHAQGTTELRGNPFQSPAACVGVVGTTIYIHSPILYILPSYTLFTTGPVVRYSHLLPTYVPVRCEEYLQRV